jgi:hypothetical protein
LKSQTESRPKARVVGVWLFVAALALALLGGLTTPTFDPTSPNAAYWFNILTWSSQSVEELALGVLTLALLLIFLSFVATELERFDWRIPVPRAVRYIGLGGAISGLVVFAALAFADVISIGDHNLDVMGPLILRSFYVAHVIDLNHVPGPFNIDVIGKNATVALVGSISCMLVYRLEQGVLTALSKAVTLFAAPAVMIFEIGLLLFGPATMPLQAANFLVGSPLAGILTNWFLLVVSSGLYALELANRRHLLGQLKARNATAC